MRLKENWEHEVKKSISLKENKMEEIYERRKSLKTKKKKLELIKECKITLTEMLPNWKITLEDAEEIYFKMLLEKIFLEKKAEDDWRLETPKEEIVEFKFGHFRDMVKKTKCAGN